MTGEAGWKGFFFFRDRYLPFYPKDFVPGADGRIKGHTYEFRDTRVCIVIPHEMVLKECKQGVSTSDSSVKCHVLRERRRRMPHAAFQALVGKAKEKHGLGETGKGAAEAGFRSETEADAADDAELKAISEGHRPKATPPSAKAIDQETDELRNGEFKCRGQ